MASQEASLTLTAQCLCKAHSFTTTVNKNDLPLKASCCHCNSCRHVTGALYTCDVAWTGSPEAILSSSLSKYAFTKKAAILFCGTCSSPMFWHTPTYESAFTVFTGVLSNVAIDELITISQHIFVGDTMDGGASLWLSGATEPGTKLREGGRDSQEVDLETLMKEMNDNVPKWDTRSDLEQLSFRCHCGGVDLRLLSGQADYAAMEPRELPWYIEPKTHKRHARIEACDSCRLSFGTDVCNWTFSNFKHIAFPSQGSCFPGTFDELKTAVSDPERDSQLGTLTRYESSPGVQRYFCSRCSATVFHTKDKEPEVTTVAVGLLECQAGARAENFLFWDFAFDPAYDGEISGDWRKRLLGKAKVVLGEMHLKRGYPNTRMEGAVER